MSKKTLSPGISLAALLAAWPFVPAAVAQDDANVADEDVIDEVVVTGSRMRGTEAPVGSPIITMDRDDIDTSNAISVDEMIKELPQVFDLGISEASRGQSGGNGNIVWGNSINLRGIGPYATLALIDGHRVNNNGRTVDPSILPSLALERVEVVADGSSAVYGSDAIAGVVNMIMRRNVDGMDAVAQYGVGDNYDEYKAGISWGTTFDRGSIFVAGEVGERNSLNSDDRDFFTSDQRPHADYRVTQCNPGTLIADGQSYAIPEEGVTPANAGSLVAGTENLCESLPHQDLLPRQEYQNLAFTSHFDVTDNLSLFLDGFYADRDFSRQPSYASGTLSVPSSNAFFVDPSGSSPGGVTVEYSFAGDLPANEQTGFQRNWEATTGFKWSLPADWYLEGLVTYGDLREVSSSTRGLDSRGPTSDLAVALASSDPATAFDPFGLHRTSPAVLAAISDQIFIADTSNELVDYELVANGGLFDLPGGTAQLAVGLERQEWTNEPGLQRGGPGAPNNVRHFERDVDSYYGELLIPLVGAGNALPGIQNLELNIAARHDDYSDMGTTSNPKYGITWGLLDNLTLRASYGTSFRAPLFSQLYGNSSALFVQPYTDPTQGGAVVQGVALSGGNLDLSPEEAETWTLGVDYSPAFLPDLSVNFTYFNVEYEGQVETYLADLSILALEEEFEGTGIILRDAEAEARVNELLSQGFGYARGVPPTPVTLFVDGRTNNLGRSEMSGFDFSVNYALSLDEMGLINFNVGGMFVDSYEESITPTGTMNDLRNTIFNPLKFKSRSSVDWHYGDFSTRLVWNYVNSYKNDRVTPFEHIDAHNTFDLTGSWSVGDQSGGGWVDGWVMSLDIDNLLDEEPPYANLAPGVNGGGGYDPTTASPVGRVISLGVRKSL